MKKIIFNLFISSITIERINRAGEKIKTENPLKQIDVGYKVFSLTDSPKEEINEENQLIVKNLRENKIDTLYNMMIATGKTLNQKIIEIRKDAIYQIENQIYILSEITDEELQKYRDYQINIDAYSQISLEQYLNLGIAEKENINIVY